MKSMATTTKTLYEMDFVEWTARTAELLREGRFECVDLEHLVEEVEDLGKSERSAVRSQMARILMHLVKQRIQPERGTRSWRSSIVDGRRELQYKLEDSPSLRPYLNHNLQKFYCRAVQDALVETGLKEREREFNLPERCPWSLDELLDGELPDIHR